MVLLHGINDNMIIPHLSYLGAWMGITRSTLPQNNGDLYLPFFCGNDPI